VSVQPLVSVRTITYNHEKYIAQCLEGILMQRTDFPFEAVIGEDCSTDRTREIVLAYAKKYPDKLRVITSEENVGVVQNALRVQRACRGKYQAFCEGDDYWIDPLKLQKQVDLLEAHPDLTLCFHNVFVVRETDFRVRLYVTFALKETLNFAEACPISIPTASVMARSEILASLPQWRFDVWDPDTVLLLWCAHHGNLGYLNEIMSVYRRHPGSLTSSMRPLLAKRQADALYAYQKFDQETLYQHTDIIQTVIEQKNEYFRRKRSGRWYYLLHPHKMIATLKKNYALIGNLKKRY